MGCLDGGAGDGIRECHTSIQAWHGHQLSMHANDGDGGTDIMLRFHAGDGGNGFASNQGLLARQW